MNSELPKLPNYQELKDFLEIERKTIIKINEFSDEDVNEYVRSLSDAHIVFDMLEKIHNTLWNCFDKHPDSRQMFNEKYMPFFQLVNRDYILELCFLENCIFPETEEFVYSVDGKLDLDKISENIKFFEIWSESSIEDHEKTQELLKEKFSIELKTKNLECQCIGCIAEYRTKLRETIFSGCIEVIEKYKEEIDDNIYKGIRFVSSKFTVMQKEVDKYFYKVRYRLKRSSLNRLEKQIKGRIKDTFLYPSAISLKHVDNLRTFFNGHLDEQDLNKDLISEGEYERFFKQLGKNIWRSEKYLEDEFKKFIKSILFLKRKDISSNILREYLGEFWNHSLARDIRRKIVYHMGPTNSGKTYHAIQELCEAKSGCYLAPLRLLAGELYDTMNSKGVPTTLLTGEEVIPVEGAKHFSSTIEMARFQENFDCCVIDEIQMITDGQRGWAWTRALVNVCADVIHICGDASAYDLVENIVDLCGDTLEVRNYERMTDLNVEKKSVVLGELDKSDALIVFSRRKALQYKYDLEQLGFNVSIVYGRLSPEVRREQARKFDQQETDIIVSTDAIAMGMNLPIKRIVFSTLSKYYNAQEHQITDSEIKQIAGRAGRYQRFPTGYVTCLAREQGGIEKINSALKCTLPQQEKCMVGPDLDIFSQVNNALIDNGLTVLKLSEFLRLFNTMMFKKPFYCVDLKEMIELAEMVEDADENGTLSTSEIFGFACAPVNLGLMEHVQYYVWILNHFASGQTIFHEPIDRDSSDIDYLETSIKCIELFQWLSRHFNNKYFNYDEIDLLENKSLAIAKLNGLLSEKIVPTCSSCGQKLEDNTKFAICESCFKSRRFSRGRRGNEGQNNDRKKNYSRSDSKKDGAKNRRKRPSDKRNSSSRSKSASGQSGSTTPRKTKLFTVTKTKSNVKK